MKAVRFAHSPDGDKPFSPTNPAPASALQIHDYVPMPSVSKPGEVVVQIKASSVIRDNLTWPEMYSDMPAHMGNDFAGTVVQVHPNEATFKVGDEVYGMARADRGGTWAEYALVTSEESFIKPSQLSWEQAASLPLSALTADQALFTHARLPTQHKGNQRIIITGASGGVGTFLVQFAAAAGYQVVAASSSVARDKAFLRSIGATVVVGYSDMALAGTFDVIVDTRGGTVLQLCWSIIQSRGTLISVDSGSWNFVTEHREKGVLGWRESVQAKFFIVEPSKTSMERISAVIQQGKVQVFVSQTIPFSEAVRAYGLCQSESAGRGKIVLIL